ncbi:hypothetical protein Y032_0442g1537 [Ancylostoma ceylanicum]|nr:hypothetical protein Y032_0442g1537 [Ancylostoma ceylanicum]
MMFIFNGSDALYPSIYLGFNATSEQRFRYVQAIIKEARRISMKFSPPLPIYAYTKIEYDPLKKINDFYDDKIKTTIDQHEKCRKDRCNGHGKCVLEGNSTCPDSSNYAINTDEYKCECDKGFNGPRCSS